MKVPLMLFAALLVSPSTQSRPRSPLYFYKHADGPYLCNFAKVNKLASPYQLAIRSGPDPNAPRIDSLEVGAPIYICDYRQTWLKIYYGKKGEPCGRIEPNGIESRQVATCRSGWVRQDRVDVISG